MDGRYSKRIGVHIAAVLSAIAMWWLLAEFAVALGASLVAFLLVNGLGHLAFGPMPSGDDLRRDVEVMLRRRE